MLGEVDLGAQHVLLEVGAITYMVRQRCAIALSSQYIETFRHYCQKANVLKKQHMHYKSFIYLFIVKLNMF